MSRVFADITSNAEKDPTAPSPKTRRLNMASRKISREIRLAVLAQDVIALKSALKAAEELDMDTHLIKAARASLHDMENQTNDENIAPGFDSNNCPKAEFKTPVFEPSLAKARPGESTTGSRASFHLESSSNISVESNSESDGFFVSTDFENLAPPEGEKETPDFNACHRKPIAYSLNLLQQPALDHQISTAETFHADEGKPADEEGWSSEMNHYKNHLQPTFSERIARMKFESAKIDTCCKDFCQLLKLQHSAQEKWSGALVELVDEINSMGMSKTGMTLDATSAIVQSQILTRSNKSRELITNSRKEFVVPILTSIPAIEIEVRSLFEEVAFLESECSKAIVDLERTNKQIPNIAGGSKDDCDCLEPVTLRETRRLSGIGITVREPRRLSGIGVSLLRRPSVANRSDGEYFCQYEHACAKIEAEIIFKQVLSEYTHRVPEIIQSVADLNSKRVQLMKDAFSGTALADQRRLEDELLEQKNLVSVIQQTDLEKDLANIRCLSEMKSVLSGHYLAPTEGPLDANNAPDVPFADPNRERSFAVDLWAGNGIDVALEHALSSKQTICSLHQLIASIAHILQQRSELLSKSVKLVQAQVSTEQARIGDLQWHAFQTLINATRIQAASYDACATSLRQTLAELRFQKQMLKSVHRTISEGRARSLKDLNAAISYQTKCKDLRDKLELELSNSQKQVLDNSLSYRTCPNQGQLEGFLGKLERDERAFRQADLAYRNAQHSIQASRETQAIMQCQFLSKLQSAEESRLQSCLKTFRALGYGVRDLVNAVEQSDLDVMSAFAAVDINKDLKQFIMSTYSAESDIKSSDVDYVTHLSSDGFGPAYDYALSGLSQMKHMLVLLEQWADSSEYIKFLSKIKTVAPNTELSSVQAALLQCQHLVFGFCQSVDDHAASHREIIANVDKQRHLLKAEARKIRKKFTTVHRRVTLAIQNHSQAAETQRRLTEKLQVVRQQSANASQANVNTGKFNFSKFFSRDLSKTLHKTEEGVSSSKTVLDRFQQELSAAIRERESVVKSSLHSLQEIENNRIAALSWCIPTLINHRQEISSQVADLAQCLISSCEEIDIKADLQAFIRSSSLGVSPPAHLFQRVLALHVACGEKSSNCSKSRNRSHRYNSEEEEGISRSTFSIGEEPSAAPSDHLFGGNLANAPIQNGVSKIVATCIAFLTSRQSQITATTFREPCPAADVNALINEFRRDPDTVLVTQTVSCVANVLKTYISELQPALIPSNMASEFLTIYRNPCSAQRCPRIREWLSNLPAVHRNTLKLVLLFLSEISRCPTSQATNMAVTNLAISWSPILLHSAVGTTIQALSRLLHDTPAIFNDSEVSS